MSKYTSDDLLPLYLIITLNEREFYELQVMAKDKPRFGKKTDSLAGNRTFWLVLTLKPYNI